MPGVLTLGSFHIVGPPGSEVSTVLWREAFSASQGDAGAQLGLKCNVYGFGCEGSCQLARPHWLLGEVVPSADASR